MQGRVFFARKKRQPFLNIVGEHLCVLPNAVNLNLMNYRVFLREQRWFSRADTRVRPYKEFFTIRSEATRNYLFSVFNSQLLKLCFKNCSGDLALENVI